MSTNVEISSVLLRNARLIIPPGPKGSEGSDHGTIEGALFLRAGRIEKILRKGDSLPSADKEIDCEGDYLAPGFIDLHCHGAMGRDAMEATPEAFAEILRFHAGGGTTAVALTTVAAPLTELIEVLKCAHQSRPHLGRNGAALLGIHLEGPYFSTAQLGAHRLEELRDPSAPETAALLNYADVITQVTLAPERTGSLALIGELVNRGIRASAGHSDATELEARAGVSAGIAQVTHLYNCMSSARKHGSSPLREGGLVEVALTEPSVLCELIADGFHVPPVLLRLTYLAKGWSGIALITDAAAGTGLPLGTKFSFGDIACQVADGIILVEDGTRLAGSSATMMQVVKTMVTRAGVPLNEAIAMASTIPAKALGISEQQGALRIGLFADIVRFTPEWQVRQTWIKGSSVFENGNS